MPSIALTCLSSRVAWGLAPRLEAKVAGTPITAAVGKVQNALSPCQRASSLLMQFNFYFPGSFPWQQGKAHSNQGQ